MFGSSREDWSPDQPDAFAEPLIVIPWVQVLDLLVMDNTCWILGEVTHGESGDFADGSFLGAEDLTGIRFIQSDQDNGEGAAAGLFSSWSRT